MTRLFVDTGAFYGAADLDDRHHEAAEAVFAARGTRGDLVTTDHVMVETWMLIRARLGRPAALQYWDAMLSGVVEVLGVTGPDVVRAREIARGWPDQAFSIVDCTSFAVMERVGLTEVFAFDQHFRVFRYGHARSGAFVVVR